MNQWTDESISKNNPVFIRLTEILLETASRIANLTPFLRFRGGGKRERRGSQVVRPSSAKALSRVRFPPTPPI